MSHPQFFNEVPSLLVHDPLAGFLGATGDGLVEYRFVDAVRLAGHSCPTVAGAWLMASGAMRALWPGAMPQRGGVAVAFRHAREHGVTGVIASVVTLVTGAADDAAGFKGIGGRYDRRLVRFEAPISADARFTRCDNHTAVDVSVDLGAVPAAPEMGSLLERSLAADATADDMARFAACWQDRVRRILADPAAVLKVVPVTNPG